jgi:molybdate transport system ATP-binding protein
VTHALEEVVQLADSLVLIEAGRVVAAGDLSDIAARADLPLARRDDAGAVLTARIAAHDVEHRLTRLDAGGATFWVPLVDAPLGSELRIRIPAREVILALQAPEAISVHNVIAGVTRAIAEDAPRRAALVDIALPQGALLSRVTPDAVAKLALAPGVPVLALVKSMTIEVLVS